MLSEQPPPGSTVLSEIAHPFISQDVARRLLDDGTVLFAAIASTGAITWISDSSRFLLGAAPDELVGVQALDLLHPDDHEILVETLGEEARGADDRIRVALRLRHTAGHWVSLEFGGIDLRDPAGAGLFLVWGSPNEATGRLLVFLNSLLAGADLGDLLDQVVVWHDSTTPGTRTAVLVRRPDGSYAGQARSASLPAALAGDLPADGSVPGPWVDALRHGQLTEWTELDGLEPAARVAADEAGLRAVWAVPVVAPGARTPEALLVHWRTRPGRTLATQRRQIDNTAQVVRLAIKWSVAHDELVTAATTDPLTGLANRSQLDARIRADRSPLAAVLFCDLDDFKRINDRHGHLVGDRILRETARRMTHAVRPGDLLVRLGGDEFAVWCADLASPLDAEAVAERLIATLDVPIELDGHAHRIGVSVGVAVSAEGDPWATDVDRLLGAADGALYRAKGAGKGRWATAHGTDQPLPFPE